jgi:hypothetical protein
MAADREVICAKWEQKYFCREDWTGSISLNPKENFFSRRAQVRAHQDEGTFVIPDALLRIQRRSSGQLHT